MTAAATAAATACVALVRGLIEEIPARLDALAARRAELGFLDDVGGGVVVAGVGASEGPARYLEALLTMRSVPVRFVPMSELAFGAPERLGRTLVLFSQGLSPNARLALQRAAAFERAVLVTSVDDARATGDGLARLRAFQAHGGRVVAVESSDEQGMLARFQGPAVACFAAAAAVARLPGATFDDDLARVSSAVAEASRGAVAALARLPERELGRFAFVTCRAVGSPYHGLRWTCLEALGEPQPHSWDVLHIAHGAYQEIYPKTATLLALEGAGAEDAALFDRLERMLVPDRHALLRVRATLPRELALFEYAAFVDQLVLRALEASPRDLCVWPGKGLDAPLYGLDGSDGSP